MPVHVASIASHLNAHYSLITKGEYYCKGREPYKQLIHTVYTLFNTLLLPFPILLILSTKYMRAVGSNKPSIPNEMIRFQTRISTAALDDFK